MITATEPAASRRRFNSGFILAYQVTQGLRTRASVRVLLLREPPLYVSPDFFAVNVGNAKSIEGGGAVVKKEDVRARVLAVARIDALVLAVVNPKPVKNDRHAREA